MNILAISPHPDDVEFSISGILLKIKKNIEDANITIAYNTKYDLNDRNVSLDYEIRKLESKLSCKMLGAEYTEFSIEDSLDDTAHLILEVFPDIVFVPYYYDYNMIHKKTTEHFISAIEVARKLNKEETTPVKQLLYYQSYSSENFTPDFVVNVSDTYVAAKKILNCHKTGINTLQALPYKFQIMHQLRGLDSAMPYGEGVIRDSSTPYNWNINLRVFSKFLYDLTWG